MLHKLIVMETTQRLIIKKINNNYDVTICNTNKINIINANEIESRVIKLVKESGKIIHFNLKEINFIDSTGFNTLLKIQRTAYLNNVRFLLYNVNQEVLELFDLLGLNNEFEISNNVSLRQNLKRAS